MKNLVIGLKAMDEKCKQEVHNTFLEEFGVDLDSNKFISDDFYSSWKLLLENCVDEKNANYRESLSENIFMFKTACISIVDPEKIGTKIIRASQIDENLRKNRIKNFKKLIEDFRGLLKNCYFYEADVWLNAWFAIQYINCDRKRLQDAEGENRKTKGSRKPTTGFIDTATGYVKDKGGHEYALPFQEDADGYFCGEYLIHVLKLGGELFWTEQEETDNIDENQVDSNKQEKIVEFDVNDGLKKCMTRKEISMLKDRDYSRYGYRKIKELEEQKDFHTEDIILFHKTVNGVWVRNMVNTMIDYEGGFEAEDYIGLVDVLCECKSLVWQNLISYIFIVAKRYERELKIEGVFDDVIVLLYIFINHINGMNNMLARLTEGFIYLYQRVGCREEIIEKKCRDYLNELELEHSEKVNKIWDGVPLKLRVTEGIKKNHICFEWIYAIFQREVIHRTKFFYREGGLFESPFIIKELPIYYEGTKIILKNVPKNFSPLKPNLDNQGIEKMLAKKDRNFR